MESPKGKYRMWHVGLIALIFLGLSASQSGASSYIWLWEAIHSIGRIGLAVFAFYYAVRSIVHTRTHELTIKDRANRELYLIIALGIVLCGVFSGL